MRTKNRVVAVSEGRDDAVLGEGGVVEVAQHRGAARMRHGVGMLRALPGRVLALMAGGAGLAADEGGRRRGARRRAARLRPETQRSDAGQEDQPEHEQEENAATSRRAV